MVQSDAMKTGEYIVAGSSVGRVRAMVDHLGKRQKIE